MVTRTYYEIPTVASPQTFSIQLLGVTYNMRLNYHSTNAGFLNAPVGITSDFGTFIDTNDMSSWVLDINDSDNNPIACGIPLITGIDLLYQYQYLNIGGSLVASTDGSVTAPPTFGNLGTSGHLYFVVTTN
jgi:hypothetical protein